MVRRDLRHISSCGWYGKDRVTHLRIVLVRPQVGQAEELAKRWKEFWTSRFPSIAGFSHAYFAVDRDAGTIAAVSIFESRPDLEALGALAQEFRSTLSDIADEPPVFEDYEIQAEI